MSACFPDEIRHLGIILNKLACAIKKSDETVSDYETEYRESKRYLAIYRHEIDPKEVFVNELSLKQIETMGSFTLKQREKLLKLKESPYFARVDFLSEQEEEAYYIGRFSFEEEQRMYIFDWRAPVSNLFYDYEPGLASYEAPAGRVEGELKRKRQFRIRQGHLEYVLESAMHIQDDVLQQELSQTSDEKMKTIIATIQKEQNKIIRNAKSDTLIIQGVAGSGKTSVALHRIAYLLYRQKEKLSAQNIVILSPNKVFADYISSVLPELGEEPVFEMSFEELASIQLEGVMRFEKENDEANPVQAARARFKASFEFLALMDRYLAKAALECFAPLEEAFNRYGVRAKWIMERYRAYTGMPVKKRLSEVADDLLDRLKSLQSEGDAPPLKRTLQKELAGMLKIKNTLKLYHDFYKKIGASEMFYMPAKNTLEWADVYPFLYFMDAFEGLKTNQMAKHIVIDEMQDYTPVQYAVINRLFTCKKTILGDCFQQVRAYHSFGLEGFKRLYEHPEIVTLNKSYRSSCEIMAFAKSVLHIPALDTIERHGDKPRVLGCKDSQEETATIKEILKEFTQGPLVTLGIILKTQAQAQALYENIHQDFEAHLLTPESDVFANGITVASVRMSKGLEFDEVVIPFVDSKTYNADFDRHLLYIACTRAMHRLTLVYSGERTHLIHDMAY